MKDYRLSAVGEFRSVYLIELSSSCLVLQQALKRQINSRRYHDSGTSKVLNMVPESHSPSQSLDLSDSYGIVADQTNCNCFPESRMFAAAGPFDTVTAES